MDSLLEAQLCPDLAAPSRGHDREDHPYTPSSPLWGESCLKLVCRSALWYRNLMLLSEATEGVPQCCITVQYL